MAPIIIEPGQSRIERRNLSLTKADKERILQNFPEKITVSVPGFGGQEFPLRVFVKSFLDQIQPPVARMTFSVRGDPEDLEGTMIENAMLKVIGPSSGSFKAVDVEIAYAFDIEVEPGETVTAPCKCENRREGEQRTRTFKFVWQIEIAIDPGIAGVFEIEEFEVVVQSPCVCAEEEPKAEDDEEEDEDDRKHKKRFRKKKSRSNDD